MASINYPIGMNLGGDPSQALVHSNPTGKFTVSLSAIDLGQGMKSVTRQIAAETLGVPVDDVYVDTADSDTGPHDMGSFASRGTHRVGNAVAVAAREARGVMMEAAAEELEVNASDLETDGLGNIHVKGGAAPQDLHQGRGDRGAIQAGQDHRGPRHLPGAALRGRPRDRRDEPCDLLRACLPRRRGRSRRRDRRSRDDRDELGL
jgi:CO/xanthine dehydrogenase Mo-binding subunit